MKTALNLIGLAVAGLLAACQSSQPETTSGLAYTSPPPTIMTPAVHAQAFRLFSQFEGARSFGGMRQVSWFVGECYQEAMYPAPQKLPLRDCMILDAYALRYNNMVERGVPDGERLAGFQSKNFDQRIGKYGALAGFKDMDVMSGYLLQGSNAMKIVAKELNEKQPF